MQQASASGPLSNSEASPNRESGTSGVSWGAVVAGAFVAAALSLSLLALGAGFGLLSVSPWAHEGAQNGPRFITMKFTFAIQPTD